ncbi:MaoC family dehydratase [Acinetobacter pittii]|uniref:MaoC family dehydratase n=1 Tax=Acinetobacter pittii TaxID=48296 RepID=UPI0038923844
MTTKNISLTELLNLKGHNLGSSSWVEIDQNLLNSFAKVTRDEQFIHVDGEKAKANGFSGTIAHGFLTLSFLSHMSFEVIPTIKGTTASINYGINNLRFLSPVPCNSKIRGHFVLNDIIEKNSGQFQIILHVTVEIQGYDKPALVAEWVTLLVTN